jgi:hypothetical protein
MDQSPYSLNVMMGFLIFVLFDSRFDGKQKKLTIIIIINLIWGRNSNITQVELIDRPKSIINDAPLWVKKLLTYLSD